MKKLFPLLIAFTLLFSFPLPTFAAESNDRQQNTSFEISLEEALALADPADITVQNGITTIPVKLDISEEVYTEVVIKVNNLTRARAKSFSMEGWFRLTSSKEIVSVYGLDGTFEYTGSSATFQTLFLQFVTLQMVPSYVNSPTVLNSPNVELSDFK